MIWRPDTCGCVIEETHDPQDSAYGVRFSAVISKCPVHAAVSDANLYGVIYSNSDGENKRKNLLDKFLRETAALSLTTVDASGAFNYKAGIVFNWSWDASRNLVVSVTGVTLTTNQKNSIRAYCDANFGVGKVIVQ